MLKINNLNHSFEDKVIFNNAELEISDGEIIWLKGENGSGKTTLFRILSGVLEPSAPEPLSLYFNNVYMDLATLKQHINFIPNSPYLFEYLNGKDNIAYLVSLFDLGKKYEHIMENMKTLNLASDLELEVHAYSLGMKAKLYLGVMLERDAQIILIDEILSSVDTEALEIIIGLLEKKLVEQKCSIIFSSHVQMMKKIKNTKCVIITNERLEKV